MSIALKNPPKTQLQESHSYTVRELEERLRITRERVIRQRILYGALLLVSGTGIALGVISFLDLWLELGTPVRAVWLLAVIASAIATAVAGWRRSVAHYSLSKTAADAERQVTEFGQRLRTTLDYENGSPQPAPASLDLLNSLQQETSRVSQKANWEAIVDRTPLRQGLALLGIVGLIALSCLVAIPELGLAMGRALLLPLEYTTVSYSPPSATIKSGESVTVQATVHGRPIASAELRYRPLGSADAWEAMALLPAEETESGKPKAEEPGEEPAETPLLHGELFATLSDLHQSLEFEVIAGPRTLPLGTIRVLAPLELEKTISKVLPPTYSGKESATVPGLDLRVLEGSIIEVEFTLSRSPSTVRLEPLVEASANSLADDEVAESAPLAEANAPTVTLNGQTIRGTIPDIRKSTTFQLHAEASDGIKLDDVQLNIQVQLDRPPRVQFLAPPEELIVTATTEVPMIVESRDDLGLHKVGILYQVGTGPVETLWEDDGAGTTDPLQATARLMLEEYELTHKDAITYYAYAEDNYFGSPRRTTTPLRFIDIRPYKLAYQMCEGGSCNGCSVTLEELIFRQRQNLSQAFSASERPSVSKDTLKRLSAAEADLADKTFEFWSGMVQRGGPIPELDDAARHMKRAVKHLDDAEVSEAVPVEQQALVALIKARENVRKKLSQSSSTSASQCRQFDREQKQNLRPPEKKKQDQQQRIAQARKQLEDLAERERKWSQQAKQACQNPSSSSSSSSPSKSAAQSNSKESQQSESSKEGSDQTNKPAEETPSREELAKIQEKLMAELQALRDQLNETASTGQEPSQAAQRQAQQAQQSMQRGLEKLQEQNGDQAARAGERSADQLEQLANHLGSMNVQDVAKQLNETHELAKRLASREAEIAKELGGEGDEQKAPHATSGRPSQRNDEIADQQSDLAVEADMLAERFSQLARDASSELDDVGQKLAELEVENSPAEIAAGMHRAAQDLAARRQSAAAQRVSQARQRLDDLSRELGEIQSEYAQPQLQELMALEERLAQLLERQQRSKQQGETRGDLEQNWQAIAQRLDSLASTDRRLQQALDAVRGAHRVTGEPLPPGVYPEMDLIDAPNIRELVKALQSKIQEAILAGALQDADAPVPPAYEELIQKYYRTLSDDLR